MMAHLLFKDDLKKDLLKYVKVWKPAIDADMYIRRNWDGYYKYIRTYYDSVLTTDIRDTICYNPFM
jgi:hypothetical protein